MTGASSPLDRGGAPISARRLVNGAAWTYGSQLVAVIAQFGYAAVSSRLVDPRQFGVYAVTLAITALVTLLATGGLGQTVGRLHEVTAPVVRSLCTLALVLGAISAAALGLLAPVWAAVWSTPAATPAVAVMSIAAFSAPFYGLLTGLVRRLGRFRLLAAQQLAGSLIGMALGVVAVVVLRDAESLLVSVIAGQLLTTVLCAVTARRLLGFASLRAARGELAFSAQLTVASVLSYGVGNITRIAATSSIGAIALGYWNRAEVVSLIPFQQLQTALIQTVYPEFRHDRDQADRARRVWTDLLVITGWVLMVVALLGAIAVPPLVLILLGPQWRIARTLVPILMFTGAVQAVGTMLASAMEAIGRFRWIWSTQVALLVLQGVLVVAIVATRSLVVAVLGLLVTSVVRQIWQGVLCSRHGYVEGVRLLRSSLAAILVCGGVYGIALLVLALLGTSLLSTAAVLALLAVAVLVLRRRIAGSSVVGLIGRYGLLPGRSSRPE